MKPNELTQFRLVFSADSVTDKRMSLSITVNDRTVFEPRDCDPLTIVNFESILPCRIQINVSGKDLQDTQIDEHGNIVRDTYIRLDSILIDRMLIKKWFLESKFLKFHTENQILTSNYFGFNGQAIIDITHPDSFTYLLSLQEHRD